MLMEDVLMGDVLTVDIDLLLTDWSLRHCCMKTESGPTISYLEGLQRQACLPPRMAPGRSPPHAPANEAHTCSQTSSTCDHTLQNTLMPYHFHISWAVVAGIPTMQTEAASRLPLGHLGSEILSPALEKIREASKVSCMVQWRWYRINCNGAVSDVVTAFEKIRLTDLGGFWMCHFGSSVCPPPDELCSTLSPWWWRKHSVERSARFWYQRTLFSVCTSPSWFWNSKAENNTITDILCKTWIQGQLAHMAECRRHSLVEGTHSYS